MESSTRDPRVFIPCFRFGASYEVRPGTVGLHEADGFLACCVDSSLAFKFGHGLVWMPFPDAHFLEGEGLTKWFPPGHGRISSLVYIFVVVFPLNRWRRLVHMGQTFPESKPSGSKGELNRKAPAV